MAYDDGLGLTEGIDQTDQIPCQLKDIVVLDPLRLIRLTVAALVGCDHMITGIGNGRYLMAPGVP